METTTSKECDDKDQFVVKFGAWDCCISPSLEQLTNWTEVCTLTASHSFIEIMLNITPAPCMNIIRQYLNIGTVVHVRCCFDRLMSQLDKELDSDQISFNYEISCGEWYGLDYRMLRSSIESNRRLRIQLSHLHPT